MSWVATLVLNRLIGLAHRLVGFGTAPEPFDRVFPQDAPCAAELAVELRLRRIAAATR